MEERIASPAKTIEILQSNDFQFLKKFGQNFLIDLHVLDKIIRAADVQAEDVCVEIGPGIGSLTQALAEAGITPRPVGIGGATVAALLRHRGLAACVWSTILSCCHEPNEHSSITATMKDAQVFARIVLGSTSF